MYEIIRLLMFFNLICSYIHAQKFYVIFEIFFTLNASVIDLFLTSQI